MEKNCCQLGIWEKWHCMATIVRNLKKNYIKKRINLI